MALDYAAKAQLVSRIPRTHARQAVVEQLLSLLRSGAYGPGDRLPQPPGEAPGFVGPLWHALASLFAPLGSLMHPDGLTANGGTCSGERGSIMDPNGCPGAKTDNGSLMDPNG